MFDFPLALQLIDSAKTEQVGQLGRLLSDTDAAYRTVTGKSGVDAPFLTNHDQERVMSMLYGNPQHAHGRRDAADPARPAVPLLRRGAGHARAEARRGPARADALAPRSARPGESRWKDFSAGDGPAVSVEAEQADPHSLLNDYRMLIDWRRDISALRDGDFATLDLHQPQVAAWELRDAHSHVIVLHNLGANAQTVDLKPAMHAVTRVLKQSGKDASIRDGKLLLPAYSTAILE